MKSSRRDRQEWRIFLQINAAAAIISAFYGITVRTPGSSMAVAALTGVVTSLLIASPIAFVEVRRDRVDLLRRLRRLPLAAYFGVKVMFYLVVIVGGLLLGRTITSPLSHEPVALDATFRTSIIFSIIMSVGANIFFEMGFLLGFGTLTNLVSGRYVQPKREQRAFLLIDMKDSTGVAERLGPVLFHELLNDFLRDVADAALECDAEIYKYVGDEAILTWTSVQALDDGACLACPFLAREFMEAHRARYLERFGAVPTFRAAAHYGEIVTGEIGDLRREIAYVGDTLNVTARLLDAAKTMGHDVLVSNDLLHHAKLPSDLEAEPLPTLTVRGRAAPLGISALRQRLALAA
jgi:adenylate cyclase